MLSRLTCAGIFGGLVAWAAWSHSPWPSLLFYRLLLNTGGIALNFRVAKHVPKGVEAIRDISYHADDQQKLFDVYRPASRAGETLPLIVWVHSGGYLSGDKGHVANYLKIMASRGYVTVGLNYTLAPTAKFPGPVRDVAEALAFLHANAARFGIDGSRIVLAGDSAGAQIAAQVATIVTSPVHAGSLHIAAPLPRHNLRGVVLFCGLYDPDVTDNADLYSQFLRVATWAYFGVEDISRDARKRQFSVVANITRD